MVLREFKKLNLSKNIKSLWQLRPAHPFPFIAPATHPHTSAGGSTTEGMCGQEDGGFLVPLSQPRANGVDLTGEVHQYFSGPSSLCSRG